MRKKEESENSFFGGFEAVVDGLARIERVNPGSSSDPEDDFETVTDIGERLSGGIPEYPLTEPSEITGGDEEDVIEDNENLEEPKNVRKSKEEKEDLEDTVEEEEIEEPSPEDVSDLGEYEKDVVDFFTERFINELGWELDDETKPKSVGDVVEYLKNIVETNSQPEYASEEIQKLNDYVANGGDLKKFYEDVYSLPDFDSLNIESESVQKRVLSENFARLGYNKEKIDKFISRYEDSGTLQEEAEDALEELKSYSTKRAEELLVEQEKLRKGQLQQQQKFYNDVYNSIDKTDSIRGIPISAKEKKDLHDYIFKPEADGLTKYQKDYAKDYKNLIESAYFTMKGDSLIKKVTQKATSQAAKNLQDKLANKGKRVKNSGTTHGGQSNTLGAWDTVSRQLRRPNF